MQKNASLLAIVAVDTAENEPSEVGGDVGCEWRAKVVTVATAAGAGIGQAVAGFIGPAMGS